MSDRSGVRPDPVEGLVLGSVSMADRVVGGAYLATAAGVVGVAGAEAGSVAAVALGSVMVGLPVLVAGVAVFAHHRVSGDAGDGAR